MSCALLAKLKKTESKKRVERKKDICAAHVGRES